jgi:hypothetical protein
MPRTPNKSYSNPPSTPPTSRKYSKRLSPQQVRAWVPSPSPRRLNFRAKSHEISPTELICHFKTQVAVWMPCKNLPLENPLIKLALTIVTLKFTDLAVEVQVDLREKYRKTLMKKLQDDRTMEGLLARLIIEFDHCGAANGLVSSSASGYVNYLTLSQEPEYVRPGSNVISSTVDEETKRLLFWSSVLIDRFCSILNHTRPILGVSERRLPAKRNSETLGRFFNRPRGDAMEQIRALVILWRLSNI